MTLMKLRENIFVTYRVNIPILRASTNHEGKREKPKEKTGQRILNMHFIKDETNIQFIKNVQSH